MKKKEHPTLRYRIYSELKQAIVEQTLRPGKRVMEDIIAEEMGVSRTPVREAVTQLASDGLLEIVPRKGTFVIDMSQKAVNDVLDIREALECLAARRAAEQVKDEEIVYLQNLCERYEQHFVKQEYEECIQLDQMFHEALVDFSGNRKLKNFLQEIGNFVQMTRAMDCRDRGNISLTLSEHNCILDALVKHNSTQAVRAVSNHLRRVRNTVLEKSRNSKDQTTDGVSER